MPVLAIYEAQGSTAGPTDEQFSMMAAMFGGTFRDPAERGTGSGGQARTVAVFDSVTTTSTRTDPMGKVQTFGDSLKGAAQSMPGTAYAAVDVSPTIPPPWTA